MPGSVAAQILAGLSGKRTPVSPVAGKRAPREALVGVTRLQHEYFEQSPDPGDPKQLVSFGTSGHRGSPLKGSFTEAHILAITQAICDYRRSHGVNGPFTWERTRMTLSARTGKDPSEHYRELTAEFGAAFYTRIDAPATLEQKLKLQKLSAEDVKESELAGEPIIDKLTCAPGRALQLEV